MILQKVVVASKKYWPCFESLRCPQISTDSGEDTSVEIQKRGLLKKYFVLATTLTDMYAECGMMDKAKEAFGQLPLRDVVS